MFLKFKKTEIITSGSKTEIRPVYVFDLKDIKMIYEESINDVSIEEGNQRVGEILKFTGDFGLPLALAHCNKEVIAYAYVYLKSNQPKISVLFKKGYNNQDTSFKVTQSAENILLSMYGADTDDYTRLELFIEKIIYWLNLD